MHKEKETIQLGDYEGCRKAVCIFLGLCVAGFAASLLSSFVWRYALAGAVALIAVLGTLLLTKGKLKSKFNCTARITYRDDDVIIRIRGTKYVITYNEIAKIDYYPKQRRQISKNKKERFEFINRYEVLITTQDEQQLRLSTPFGKYYSDFRYSGLYNFLIICRRNMTVQHTTSAARSAAPEDHRHNWTYHKILFHNETIERAKKEPHNQILNFYNGYSLQYKKEHLVLMFDDEPLLDEKYAALNRVYLFEKYAAHAKNGKYTALRVLYHDHTYRDFLLSQHQRDEEITVDSKSQICKAITMANSLIERYRI